MRKLIFSIIFALIIVSLSFNDYFSFNVNSFPTSNNNSVSNTNLVLNHNPYSSALCCNYMDPRYYTGQEWYIKCSESVNKFIDSTCCVNIWAYYNFNNPPDSMP